MEVLNISQLYYNHNKGKTIPDRLVNCLVDEVLYKESDIREFEEVFKISKNIINIESSNLQIIKTQIYDSEDKDFWIILIEFELIINYVSRFGYKCHFDKIIYYEKEIPKPIHSSNEFIDLYPLVFIPKAECIDVSFENISYFSLITAIIEFEITMPVIAKQELLIKSYLSEVNKGNI